MRVPVLEQAQRQLVVIACAALFGSACNNGPDLGFAVALTMEFGPSVTDQKLGDITSLSLQTSGDETYTTTITLTRKFNRIERVIYHPDSSSRAIDIAGVALDENGIELAAGETGHLNLAADKTLSASLNFSAVTVDLGVDSTQPDLSQPDLSHDDLSIKSKPDLADKYEAVILADHPAAYYRLDESSGTTAFDIAGKGLNGTYTGSFTLAEPGALVGDSDTAARFTPTVGGVEVSRQVIDTTGTKPWSIEMWLNPRVIPGATGGSWLFELDTDGEWIHSFLNSKFGIQVERADKEGNNVGINAKAPTVGTFTHVVVTYDGTKITIYENGLYASSTPDSNAQDGLASAFYLGTDDPGSGAFDGVVDEVAIYSTALTSAQVQKHYSVGVGD